MATTRLLWGLIIKWLKKEYFVFMPLSVFTPAIKNTKTEVPKIVIFPVVWYRNFA
jgi:hypothetical protein